IKIPPLRERRDDVPLLAYRFARRTAREMGKNVHGISPEALELLQRYDWPGNVRELQHAVERAVILSTDEILQPRNFDIERLGLVVGSDEQRVAFAAPPTEGDTPREDDAVVLHSLNIDEAEKALIERALRVTENNRTRAAELLGISVRTLRAKLNSPSAA
ncbi:MAG: sigma-54-dependent Fis family transcriptional regulator, partial [Gemmatimonadetes bacterium]|nr:sigma-54-dependent Fis family transcriptional regulator [Gemmatimonadota bacterium]